MAQPYTFPGVSRASSKLLAQARGDRHALPAVAAARNVLPPGCSSGNVCSGATGSDSAEPVQPVPAGQIAAMRRLLCLLLKAEFTLTGSFDT